MTDKNGQSPIERSTRETNAETSDKTGSAKTGMSTEAEIENSVPTRNKVLLAPDISTDQKVALLEEWETDLRDRIASADEGMPGRDYGATAERLRRVRLALRALDPSSEPTPPRVTPQARRHQSLRPSGQAWLGSKPNEFSIDSFRTDSLRTVRRSNSSASFSSSLA